MRKDGIKRLSLCAIFTAFIAASAWVSIPTPLGINLTMQLFGVCLAAFCLGVKAALASVAAYIAIGAVGLPVFSSFSGGAGVLFGASGGFLWGFLAAAALCGLAAKVKNRAVKILLCVSSVAVCHLIGVIQYCLVSGVGLWAAIISASLPFLIKDFIIVFLAALTAKKLNKVLKG
ncbi:MAG: biotin transporter BioY [Clostridia bacterium]|nr:biotin transporter BioY [Clostridia bacterium]